MSLDYNYPNKTDREIALTKHHGRMRRARPYGVKVKESRSLPQRLTSNCQCYPVPSAIPTQWGVSYVSDLLTVHGASMSKLGIKCSIALNEGHHQRVEWRMTND